MRMFVIAFVLALFATPVQADGELDSLLSAFDKDRLARFEETSAEALNEARNNGVASDAALLDRLLKGEPLPVEGHFDPTGTWRCRTIKAGGILPLTVYPTFKCVIADDGAGWFLKKVTGSQRTEGRFYTESATRLVYVGASYVAGEKPRRYGQDPKDDQVAIVERRAENRLVFLFPAPQYESKLDILVLER